MTVEGRNRRDADGRAKWALNRGILCDACQRAEFKAAHEAKVAAASADPRNADLPSLTGSEKQVAWATALRLEAIQKIEDTAQTLIASAQKADAAQFSSEQVREMVDAIALAAIELRDRTEARDWIDTRDQSGSHLLAMRMRGRHALCPSFEPAQYDRLVNVMSYR